MISREYHFECSKSQSRGSLSWVKLMGYSRGLFSWFKLVSQIRWSNVWVILVTQTRGSNSWVIFEGQILVSFSRVKLVVKTRRSFLA